MSAAAYATNAFDDPRPVYSAEERNELILQHLPQVRIIAQRIHEKLPPSICLEDLVSAGVVGLISAIDNYDPSFNARLSTYAEIKIRGVILNTLAGVDGMSRQQRKAAKQIQSAIHSAEGRLLRAPTPDEIAEEMGVSVEEYYDLLAASSSVKLRSLDAPCGEDDTSLIEIVADRKHVSAQTTLERKAILDLVVQAIPRLPKIERDILGLYYLDGLTLHEISSIVGLTPSRISQLKTQAVMRLKNWLTPLWPNHDGSIYGD